MSDNKKVIHIKEQELRMILEAFDKMAIEIGQMYELFNQALYISIKPLRDQLEILKNALDGVEDAANDFDALVEQLEENSNDENNTDRE